MAKGTKDLRQAAVILLEKAKEKKDELVSIIARARDTNIDNPNEKTEDWIIISWELETQLLENQINTIEKWIVEDEYDY